METAMYVLNELSVELSLYQGVPIINIHGKVQMGTTKEEEISKLFDDLKFTAIAAFRSFSERGCVFKQEEE